MKVQIFQSASENSWVDLQLSLPYLCPLPGSVISVETLIKSPIYVKERSKSGYATHRYAKDTGMSCQWQDKFAVSTLKKSTSGRRKCHSSNWFFHILKYTACKSNQKSFSPHPSSMHDIIMLTKPCCSISDKLFPMIFTDKNVYKFVSSGVPNREWCKATELSF